MNTMFPKKKVITKSKAKKKAWKAFSEWVRKSNSGKNYFIDGTASCYTCGKLLEIKELQAGHGIPGRMNAVLFMEEVVKPQCRQCNIFKGGNLSIFTVKLIEEHGMKKYKELVERANTTVQYKVSDYLEIEEKYKNKLSQLAQLEGGV